MVNGDIKEVAYTIMNLEDLKIYQTSMSIGDEVWELVNKWDYFQKDTIGKQLVRSADSIAANLSEGYGRYHYKDAQKFNYYSRGSLYETKTWIKKAARRGLIAEVAHKEITSDLNLLVKMLNAYIKSIGPKEK